MQSMKELEVVKSSESPKSTKRSNQKTESRQKSGRPRIMTKPLIYQQTLTYPGGMSLPYPTTTTFATISPPMLTAPYGPTTSSTFANPMMGPYISPMNMPQYKPNYDNVFRGSEIVPRQRKPLDPESYLSLPKELFPTARVRDVDPNPLIDLICSESDIDSHAQWILDLEFGVPKAPDRHTNRPIAMYDAHLNNVICRNTPGTIHPGFEACSEDLKREVLFYYDGITSPWYRGFVMMNSDTSVANFQSWLQVPMETFGMCWP